MIEFTMPSTASLTMVAVLVLAFCALYFQGRAHIRIAMYALGDKRIDFALATCFAFAGTVSAAGAGFFLAVLV